MYTTLKLYYLHQQELLNQVLAILKEHVHSKQLAQTLYAYVRQMHGKNFGWVSKIEALLKGHLKATLNMSGIYRAIAHHELIHKLHTIVHHAASHHKVMIHRMFHVLRKTGFVRHHYRHMMRTHGRMVHAARHILRSVHHVFHGVRTHRVVRHLRKVSRKSITRIIKHSFRSSRSTTKVVKMMLRRHSVKTVKKVIKRILKKAKSAKTIKNAKKALKKLAKAKK
jgi:hypothetical protein